MGACVCKKNSEINLNTNNNTTYNNNKYNEYNHNNSNTITEMGRNCCDNSTKVLNEKNVYNGNIKINNSLNSFKIAEQFIKTTSNNKSIEETFFEEINYLRSHPLNYAFNLRKILKFNKNNEGKFSFDYLDKKILLKYGIKSFEETIKELNCLKPVRPLIWNDELKINFTEEDKENIFIKDIENYEYKHSFINEFYLGKLLIENRLRLINKYKKCAFNIGCFKNPKLSIILQIIDEVFNKERYKIIVNQNYKYFAINYIEIPDKNIFLSVSTFV
jgi:hypothetical protein